MVDAEEPPCRRHPGRRLPARRHDSRAIRRCPATAARRAAARRPRAGARGRSSFCRQRLIGADRHGDVGRLRSDAQCAGRDGLRADRARAERHARLRGSARPAPAARRLPYPLRSQLLQALRKLMTTLFTSDHEWLRIEGDVATVGITDYAQSQLGDVVFIELPKVGRALKKAEAAAVVESVKAASDVYAPISGEVVEVNDAVVAEPALVNSDAAGKAWFFKLRIADKSELGGLMDEAAYKAHTT